MTKRTIALAVAATLGFAASASVYEVKFTVKTENKDTGKVASKVISGLYDSDQGKHVFWTVEKQKNEKGKTVSVNVPYANTYFGLVNDTTVAKKVGQNAELIWSDTGDDANPENVLVAGAWGTAASKSGQVAGTLNGVPANGSWSAKVNTKKSYDELLAKYGLTQGSNKETSVIDQIKKDAEDSVADAQAKAAEDIAAAKDEAAKVLAATNALHAAELAAKQAELDLTTEELNNLVGALNNIDDPDMPNMISSYLDETEDKANALKTEAQGLIDAANLAFDNYTNSLPDVDAAAKTAEEAQNAYDAAVAKFDALTYTNRMIGIIYAKNLDYYYVDNSGVITLKQADVDAKKEILNGAQGDFVSYTNSLVKAINGEQAALKTLEGTRDAAEAEMYNAETNLVEATKALDEFVEPTTENSEMMTLEEFVAYEKANNKADYTDDSVKAQEKYAEYKAEFIATAKKVYSDDVAAKQRTYGEKALAYTNAVENCTGYAEAIERNANAAKLEAAINSGEKPDSTAIKNAADALDEAEKELAALKAEYAYWKNWEYSDKQADQVKADLEAAETAKSAADTALTEANNKKRTADEGSAALLDALELAIGETDLTSLAGTKNVAALREKVDAYLNAPLGDKDGKSLLGCVDAADVALTAVANIRKEMGIK